MGQSLQMLGRVDEARAAAREGVRRAERMLALNPADVRALSIGSIALFADGQHVRAMEWSQRALELNPDDTSTLVCAACVRIRSGLREQALVLLERVFEHGRGKPTSTTTSRMLRPCADTRRLPDAGDRPSPTSATCDSGARDPAAVCRSPSRRRRRRSSGSRH